MLLAASAFGAMPALAADQAVSFRGKTIRIVVGASAGGGFDAYGGFSRHIWDGTSRAPRR
jgi:tripartite-type tricarboxylate transporter receptor subunit TctC